MRTRNIAAECEEENLIANIVFDDERGGGGGGGRPRNKHPHYVHLHVGCWVGVLMW